jgi:hypothetical protein
MLFLLKSKLDIHLLGIKIQLPVHPRVEAVALDEGGPNQLFGILFHECMSHNSLSTT